ncbi:MAG TPA: hypothetical protein VGQ76_02480 [Thermoanaerobaculia bacterium]|jgi:hypothetical protein|nr:hypothetical protein [Thermoanaerobaculia bacterium]
MIVVVETNFIIELVLQQEQSRACETIVELCSAVNDVQMIVPAFAVAEAGMLLERRTGERRKLIQNDLPRHARELGRSRPLHRVEEILEELRAELGQAELAEASRWLEFELRKSGAQTNVLFVSRDDSAFKTPLVGKQLKALGCTYVNSFENALSRVRTHLQL